MIEAGSAPGASDLARFATESTATTYSATGVPNGTCYIRVRASNAAGVAGPPSNEVVVQVSTIHCAPTPPATALTVTFNSGGTVGLTWTQPAGTVASYIIEAGSAPGSSNLANTDLGNRIPKLTATGVGPGTYYVRVRARNACSVSPPSNEVSFAMAP